MLSPAEFRVAMKLATLAAQGAPLPALAPYQPPPPAALRCRVEQGDAEAAPLQLTLGLHPIRLALAPSSLRAAMRAVASIPAAAAPTAASGPPEQTGTPVTAAAPAGTEVGATPPSLEARLEPCACEVWLLLHPDEADIAAMVAPSAPCPSPGANAVPLFTPAPPPPLLGVCLRLSVSASLLQAQQQQHMQLDVTRVDGRVATLASHLAPVTLGRKRNKAEGTAGGEQTTPAARPRKPP